MPTTNLTFLYFRQEEPGVKKKANNGTHKFGCMLGHDAGACGRAREREEAAMLNTSLA